MSIIRLINEIKSSSTLTKKLRKLKKGNTGCKARVLLPCFSVGVYLI